MIKGWVKLHRDLLDHEMWLSEPFTRGQAWVDLFAAVNHARRDIWLDGRIHTVERGETVTSIMSLSARWKWSRDKVRRFLGELQKAQMIRLQIDTKKTVISIMNYEGYQGSETDDRQQAPQATSVKTTGNQQRTDIRSTSDQQQTNTNKNDQELKELKNEKEGGAEAPALPIPSKFLKVAEKALVTTDDPCLNANHVFISTGRRPMRDFPDIYLTAKELSRVLEIYEERGIPIDARKLYRAAFDAAQSRQVTKRIRNKKPEYSDCFGWLTSFEATNLMEVEIKKNIQQKTRGPNPQPRTPPRVKLSGVGAELVAAAQAKEVA